ncbi:TMEM175 family protein [Methanobrevibacter sp.]|uniref:TMEM175 family protein n=1 Tax=Methanobrevibacter sp. TaxID=66852 RepID=UPI00388F1C3E
MNKDRISALSDGIVAIAATIMVLELAVPETVSVNSLLSQLPIFYAYLLSFSLIYLAWRSHHNAFEKAKIINNKIFVINGMWLFLVTLIPFSTALVGNAPNNVLSEVIYVIVLLLWVLSFQFLDIAITKANPDVPKDEVRDNKVRLLMFGGYLIALVSAFFMPILSIIIVGIDVLVMAIFLFLNSKN